MQYKRIAMLDDLGFPSGCLPLRKSTTTVLPVLYQQRAASTDNHIKKPQSCHHFSLKFAPKTEPFHSQELPKITTYVTHLSLLPIRLKTSPPFEISNPQNLKSPRPSAIGYLPLAIPPVFSRAASHPVNTSQPIHARRFTPRPRVGVQSALTHPTTPRLPPPPACGVLCFVFPHCPRNSLLDNPYHLSYNRYMTNQATILQLT